MKKLLSLSLICLLLVLTKCNCSNDGYIPPDEVARRQSETIINSVKAKDVKSIKEILCSNLQNRNGIEKEIKALCDFIDGNIISYEVSRGGVSSKKAGDYGPKILTLTGDIHDVKTDKGKTYLIAFSSYHINIENDDLIGVVSLGILEKSAYDSINGYPDNASLTITIEIVKEPSYNYPGRDSSGLIRKKY